MVRLFRLASSFNLVRLLGACYCALGVIINCEASSFPGAYAQLQGGVGGIYTKHYTSNSAPYSDVSLRNGVAYRFSAGYLLTNNMLQYGTELGYAAYPKNTYTFSFPSLPANGTQEYKGSNVDLLAVLKINLSEMVKHDVYLLGKAGAAYVSQPFHGRSIAFDTEFVLSKTVRQFEPEVAAGIGYQFSKKINANVSYHHVFAGKANPNADSVVDQNSLTQLSAINLLMIGIAYHFA